MKQLLFLVILCGLVFPALQAGEEKVVMELVPSAKKAEPADGIMPSGKRDPFWDLLKSPKPKIEKLENLKIEELKLAGIARLSTGKFQAMFISPKNRPYIAAEGQRLLNGKIEKITFNAVTFKKIPLVKMPKK